MSEEVYPVKVSSESHKDKVEDLAEAQAAQQDAVAEGADVLAAIDDEANLDVIRDFKPKK